MPKQITEAAAAPQAVAPGRLLIGLIDPGWGSSGYYSDKVLENAATDKVWPKGTHIYFDHPTESEMYDRPERSVRDLVGVLNEDARWDGGRLVAESDVIGPYRDLVTDPVFVEAIGMSIRAAAETTTGEADGRKGTIITRLTEGLSVDLVTHAGRGGKVLAVLESARANIREATANDARDALQTAVQDANPGDNVYCWVRDFDPDKGLVYFTVEGPDGTACYQQAYTLGADGSATLTGDPLEVNVRTEYVPVTATANESDRPSPHKSPAPAGESTATTSRKDSNMAQIQIEEAELGRLRTDAGRVQALEAERDTAQTELANYRTREAARPAVTAKVNESTVLPATRKARVVEQVLAQVNAETAADQVPALVEAAVTAAETEINEILEAVGARKVTGYGAPVTESGTNLPTAADFDAAFGIVKGN